MGRPSRVCTSRPVAYPSEHGGRGVRQRARPAPPREAAPRTGGSARGGCQHPSSPARPRPRGPASSRSRGGSPGRPGWAARAPGGASAGIVGAAHRWHVVQLVGAGTRVDAGMVVLGSWPVSHGGDLVQRAEVGSGIAVAAQAPTHRQRLRLAHAGHEVDAAVAGLAPHAVGDVRAMVEVDEVGQAIDPHPRDRAVLRALVRTGSSSGLSLSICPWQFMHRPEAGNPADGERSTVQWQ